MKTLRELIVEYLMKSEWFRAIAEAAIDIPAVDLNEQRDALTDEEKAFIDEWADANR